MIIQKLAEVVTPENGEPFKRATGEIRVVSLPKGEKQRIHMKTLEEYADNFTIEDEKFTLHTVDGDVVFHVIHKPGRYCITTGKRLPDFAGNGTKLEAQRAEICRKHVESLGDKAVKHPRWPHGYVNRPNTWTCRVEDLRGEA